MFTKTDMVSVHFSALVMCIAFCVNGTASICLLVVAFIRVFGCFFSFFFSVVRFCAYFLEIKSMTVEHFSRCWFTELPFVVLYIVVKKPVFCTASLWPATGISDLICATKFKIHFINWLTLGIPFVNNRPEKYWLQHCGRNSKNNKSRSMPSCAKI